MCPSVSRQYHSMTTSGSMQRLVARGLSLIKKLLELFIELINRTSMTLGTQRSFEFINTEYPWRFIKISATEKKKTHLLLCLSLQSQRCYQFPLQGFL